jgi:ribonuclease BN (tRNA processing enzyme)
VPAKHWSPTVGVRLWDALAFITDTAFDEATIGFARGVNHLLHEAWSTSADPIAAEGDATGSDAGRIAAAAAAQQLTLIHLNPRLPDHTLSATTRRCTPRRRASVQIECCCSSD